MLSVGVVLFVSGSTVYRSVLTIAAVYAAAAALVWVIMLRYRKEID